MIMPKSLPKFKEYKIISPSRKKDFTPLYKPNKSKNWYDIKETTPQPILTYAGQSELIDAYFNAGLDLAINPHFPGTNEPLYGKFEDLYTPQPFLQLYMFRHAIELSIKALCSLKDIKYYQDSHDLLKLWTTIKPEFDKYDTDKNTQLTPEIDKFIQWLDSLEKDADQKGNRHKGENPYRYFLGGTNKILCEEKYVHMPRITEYTQTIISITESIAWEYIKGKKEWNKYCIRMTVS